METGSSPSRGEGFLTRILVAGSTGYLRRDNSRFELVLSLLETEFKGKKDWQSLDHSSINLHPMGTAQHLAFSPLKRSAFIFRHT